MADRIIAAMDYFDAHTKVLMSKSKQRALGDIDGKHGVIYPLLEFISSSVKADIGLSGVTKINPSNKKTAEEIVEEDRERMLHSAHRARSAPSPFKEVTASSLSRPMTSSSWVTGSLATKEEDKHLHAHSFLTLNSASYASVKHLSFTSPAVNAGPTNVRDEVMDEIVNKPMFLKRNDCKSAPPGGRVGSTYLKSAGTRSSRWITSTKRARTSFQRRRRKPKSWERNPGPFMTVKVSNQDLWIVSNSTPTSYFENANDDGLREMSGMTGTKLPRWENTAESVPKQEQRSPARHERQLGAPAQFTPAIQWLKYDHSSPARKPPCLSPFKDSIGDGKYYNVETSLTHKVNQSLNASPGVRIARNGEVLAQSLKLEDSEVSDNSVASNEEEESDVDVASLIPTKLVTKMKKHFTNRSDEDEESNEDESDGGHENSGMKMIETLLNGKERVREKRANKARSPQFASEEENDSDSGSAVSSHPDQSKVSKKKGQDIKQPYPALTKNSLNLLTKLAGHSLANPLLEGSNNSASSYSESIDSFDRSESDRIDSVKLVQNGTGSDNKGDQEDVWNVLEEATPGLWLTKSKQQKILLVKRLKRLRKPENISHTESERNEEVILPLCWEDELTKTNARVFDGKSGTTMQPKQVGNASLPVVFHQISRNDRLPQATVNSVIKPSSFRPHSASSAAASNALTNTKPSKGYRAPVSTPRSNRSVRSKSASTASSTTSSSNTALSGNESDLRHNLDLADLLRVTRDSLPSHVTTRSHVVKKEKVTIVHDDVSEREMETFRRVAAESMKGQTDKETVKSRETKSAPAVRSPQHQNAIPQSVVRYPPPVESLNLSSIENNVTGNSRSSGVLQRYGANVQLETKDEHSSNVSTPMATPKAHRVTFTPKNSARVPVNLISGYAEERVDPSWREYSAQRSGRKPAASPPKGSMMQINTAQGRTTGSAATSVTQGRLKSGGSRVLSSHSEPHHGVEAINGVKSGPTGGGLTEAIATLSAVVPSATAGMLNPPLKSADFIQITQPLNISSRTINQGDASGASSKMFDSYMRELASHSESDYGQPASSVGRGMIVGKSLGGTSGKSSVFPLPSAVKKNIGAVRTSQSQTPGQSQAVPNIYPFTPQAGRKSGLTKAVQEKSGQQNGQATQKTGPFGLGIKGDQVRLNLDKNINVIYKDLGLLKSGNGRERIITEQISKEIPASGRSRASSAKSSGKDDQVISIPTASEISGPIGNAEYKQNNENDSNAVNPVKVQDSGTQWSARSRSRTPATETKDDPESLREMNSEAQRVRDPAVSDMQNVDQGNSSGTDTPMLSSARLQSPEKTMLNDAHEGQVNVQETEDGKITEVLKNSDPVGNHVTDEEKRNSTEPVVAEENEPVVEPEHKPKAASRSASETLLDQLADLGRREPETTEDEEDEEEGNEEVEIKGVTRVTVNIPAKES